MRELTSRSYYQQATFPAPSMGTEYVVLKKYIPSRNRPDRFLVILRGYDGQERKALPCASLFSEFEVGDVLGLQGERQGGDDRWLPIEEPFQVKKAHIPVEVREFEIGYMSMPRKVGDSYAYVSCLQGDGWIRIPYDVAHLYFTGIPVTGQDWPSGNLYQRLGAEKGASHDDIKVAYREKARLWHPDKAPEGQRERYTNAMALVNEAWDVLGDEKEREEYDGWVTEPGNGREEQQPLKKWPGSGAGTLKVVAEYRGDTWLVRDIVSFVREKDIVTINILPAWVTFNDGSVSIQGRSWVKGIGNIDVVLGNADLPFSSVTGLNRVKGNLAAWGVKMTIIKAKRAGWDNDTKRPYFYWEERDREFAWSREMIESIERRTIC